jgi:hypothetical protein
VIRLFYLPLIFTLTFDACTWAQEQTNVDNLPTLADLREVRRFAFVIGAQHYDFLPPAENAINDALEIVRILRQDNFSSVRFLPDPRDEVEIADFMRDVHDWTGDSREPAVVVFFYAGHGFMTKDHRPYIVPVSARSGHFLEDGVPLSSILSALSFHDAGISIFLFDACRTGLPESTTSDGEMSRFGPQPSIPKLGGETYIHYATQEGAPAQSSSAQYPDNSPFTSELMKFLPRPGISAQTVFDKVNIWLPIDSKQSQFPIFGGDGVLSNLYMLPTNDQRLTERSAWAEASATGLDDCVKEFIREYPASSYLRLALKWRSSEQSVSLGTSTDASYACEK